MNISEAYVAGFLDGEGYFGLMKRSGTNAKYFSKTQNKIVIYKRHGFYPAMKVSQVKDDADILYRLQDMYGGHIHTKNSYDNHRGAVTLEIKGKKALKEFLPEIIPYLIVKKTQAELLLEFCQMDYAYRRKKDKTDWNRALEIFDELKILKGKPVATTE